MKSLLKFSVACALCAALVAPEARAVEPVPHLLNVQGVLRNVSGEVVTGTYTVTFKLYTQETAGAVLYTDTQVLSITGGVFSTQIGPMPDSTFVNRSDVWLGIQVNTDAELPRKRMTATGFAFQAEHAETADELLGAATDVSCTNCVDNNDVSILYALSDTKGGDALGLKCSGCVSGGATGDLAAATITATNIANGAVITDKILDAAVTNAKLGPDAVRTGNIQNGQVMADDIANGAIVAGKIAAGVITNSELNVLYALSDAKGGDALGLKCGSACVEQAEVSFTFAKGKTQNGDAAGLDCASCVADTEVSFSFARSDAKNGPALDLKCTNCVDATEVAFNYAASSTPAGAALDVACTSCVGETDIGVNYARGVTKNGAAADVQCSGCVEAVDVSFNYAAGDGVAGNATGLVCVNCVDTSDIRALAVTDAQVGNGISGDKITLPTSTARGTVKVGTGLVMDGTGLVTVDYTKVAQNPHSHSEYYMNGSGTNDLKLAHGKRFMILDTDDYPPPSGPGHYAYFDQGTTGNSGTTAVRLVLGPDGTAGKEWFEIWTDASSAFRAHMFDASGAAYHKGDLTLAAGANLSCTNCVDSQDVKDGTITSTDIANGTIMNDDFVGYNAGTGKSSINIDTTGFVKAGGGMYAPRFIDSDEAGNNYYADPYSTSVMNQINFNVLGLNGRSNPTAGNFAGINGTNAYLDSINTSSAGNALLINSSRCGDVDIFAGSCDTANFKMTIRGTEYADMWRDRAAPTTYYLDPSGQSAMLRLYFPGNGTSLYDADGWNYLRGPTRAFNSKWEDENGTYFLDPSVTSKFNDFEVNWVRLYNRGSNPGNPVGYSQIFNAGGNMYMAPDHNGGGYIINYFQGDDRLYFRLNGARDATARAQFSTNGHYIFLNSSVYDPRIYLNWDVGGNTYVGGTFQANQLVDLGGSGCIADPNGTSRQYEIYTTYLYSNYVRFGAMAANQIDLIGGGDAIISTGCVNQPCGHVGGSNAGFKSMWAQQFNTYSNRELKRDIKYFDDSELASTMSAQLHNLKPATYFYKTEKNLGDADASPSDIRTVPHYGMMIDEMPDALVSSEGGWSLGDSVGFLLVGAKYLEDQNREKDQKIKDLEDRVALMEQALVDAGLIK